MQATTKHSFFVLKWQTTLFVVISLLVQSSFAQLNSTAFRTDCMINRFAVGNINSTSGSLVNNTDELL